jgi:predicted metal-dependent phosphoesterase TrpH
MLRLKADFHTHCADDPFDSVEYSAESLIDAAANLNMTALAITCHLRVAHTKRLSEYAMRRGVLLLPAVELMISGKHVVAINPDAEQADASSFDDLRRLGKRDAAFIAAHPFYPGRTCLGEKLRENIDLFDAVEYCSVYLPFINPNKKAVELARECNLPLAGTSDTHSMPYHCSTHSWVDVEEKSVAGVVDAIRKGRVKVETRFSSPRYIFQIATFLLKEQKRSFPEFLR